MGRVRTAIPMGGRGSAGGCDWNLISFSYRAKQYIYIKHEYNLRKYMEFANLIESKINEIYMKNATQLEKEHNGEIVAIDYINETVSGIFKQEQISEWINNFKRNNKKVAFRRIGANEAVFRFR